MQWMIWKDTYNLLSQWRLSRKLFQASATRCCHSNLSIWVPRSCTYTKRRNMATLDYPVQKQRDFRFRQTQLIGWIMRCRTELDWYEELRLWSLIGWSCADGFCPNREYRSSKLALQGESYLLMLQLCLWLGKKTASLKRQVWKLNLLSWSPLPHSRCAILLWLMITHLIKRKPVLGVIYG